MHATRLAARLAWWEPLWVLALGGLLITPARFLPEPLAAQQETWRPYLVAALLFGWPLRRLAYGRFTVRTALDWPLLVIVLLLPVAVLISVDRALSWESLSYLVLGLALYFALINWPVVQGKPELIAWAVLATLLAATLTAPILGQLANSKVLDLPGLAPLLTGLSNLAPGSINSNRIAGFIVVLWPLSAALVLRRGWSLRRWPWLLAGLIALSGIVMVLLTQSRGAIVALAAASGLLLVLRWPRLAYGVPLALAGAGLLFYRVGSGLLFQPAGTSAVASFEGRLELWSRAIFALNDFPLTGIGMGTFDVVIPLLYPTFLIAPDARVTHAHNIFLQVGLDLGLMGLVAFLALHISAAALLASVLRRGRDPLSWCLAAGALSGLTAMLVHGLSDSAIWGAKGEFVSWLLLALAVLLGSPRQEKVQPALP